MKIPPPSLEGEKPLWFRVLRLCVSGGALILATSVCARSNQEDTIKGAFWIGVVMLVLVSISHARWKKTKPARLEKRWRAMVETPRALTHPLFQKEYRNTINRETRDVLVRLYKDQKSLRGPVRITPSFLKKGESTETKLRSFSMTGIKWLHIGNWEESKSGRFREAVLTEVFFESLHRTFPFPDDWDGKSDPLRVKVSIPQFEIHEDGTLPFRHRPKRSAA